MSETAHDMQVHLHLVAVADAGQEVRAFTRALTAIRTDSTLSETQRTTIYRALARHMARALVDIGGEPAP